MLCNNAEKFQDCNDAGPGFYMVKLINGIRYYENVNMFEDDLKEDLEEQKEFAYVSEFENYPYEN